MKRYVIPIGIVFAFLLISWAAFGQEQQTQRQPGITRRDLQNMSPEQRRQLINQMRQRRGSSSLRTDQPEQIKAIDAIQEQLVKYKTAVQNVNRQDILNFEKISEEQQNKLVQNMTKVAQERQKALTTMEEKIPVIRGRIIQNTEPFMPIRELKLIQQLAVREKAEQTAQRIERLIAIYERESRIPGRTELRQQPQITPGNEQPARP